MKIFKILLMLILTVGFFIAVPKKVSAVDVWIEGDYYAATHYIKEDFQQKSFLVPVKYVIDKEKGLVSTKPYLFIYIKSTWYAKYYESSMGLDPIVSNEFYKKCFDVCIPYCKLAQMYPRK